MSGYTITRRIEIDAAHRVPDHRSKCQNLHGHRYVIEAAVSSRHLQNAGEESGMVMDFGFLKDYMIEVIHDPYDHGLMLWKHDPLAKELETMIANGFPGLNKVALLPKIPTAENLANLWWGYLNHTISSHREGIVLEYLRVWETPNCCAIYPEQGVIHREK